MDLTIVDKLKEIINKYYPEIEKIEKGHTDEETYTKLELKKRATRYQGSVEEWEIIREEIVRELHSSYLEKESYFLERRSVIEAKMLNDLYKVSNFQNYVRGYAMFCIVWGILVDSVGGIKDGKTDLQILLKACSVYPSKEEIFLKFSEYAEDGKAYTLGLPKKPRIIYNEIELSPEKKEQLLEAYNKAALEFSDRLTRCTDCEHKFLKQISAGDAVIRDVMNNTCKLNNNKCIFIETCPKEINAGNDEVN